MSAIAYSLPGDPSAVDAAPVPVEAHTGTVTVDLTQTSLLSVLATALVDDGVVTDLRTLCTAPTSGCAGVALARLRAHPVIRAALTLTLDPTRAQDLSDALWDAAQPPPEGVPDALVEHAWETTRDLGGAA